MFKSEILALFVSLLPWLTGAILSFVFASRKKWDPLMLNMAPIVGGLIATHLHVWMVWALFVLGVSAFSLLYASLLLVMLLGALVLGAAVFAQKFRHSSFHGIRDMTFLLLLMPLGFIVAYIFSIISLLPAQGWDTLTYWAPRANEITFYLTDVAAEPRPPVHRHSLFNPILGGWNAWFGQTTVGVSHAAGPWFAFWLMSVAAVGAVAFEITQNRLMCIVVCLVAATLPLVENHVLGWGYAELVIGATLVCSSAVWTLSKTRKNKVLYLLSLGLAVCIVPYKNIGIVYFSIYFITFFVLPNLDGGKRIFLIYGLGLLVVLCYSYFLNSGDSVTFAGRELVFVSPAPAILLDIQNFAWVRNLSFSLSMLVMMIVMIEVVTYKYSGLFVSYISYVLLGLIVFIASQFTEYGYSFALPASDTGNSRFHVPIVMFTPFLVLYLFLRAEQNGGVSRGYDCEVSP